MSIKLNKRAAIIMASVMIVAATAYAVVESRDFNDARSEIRYSENYRREAERDSRAAEQALRNADSYRSQRDNYKRRKDTKRADEYERRMQRELEKYRSECTASRHAFEKAADRMDRAARKMM